MINQIQQDFNRLLLKYIKNKYHTLNIEYIKALVDKYDELQTQILKVVQYIQPKQLIQEIYQFLRDMAHKKFQSLDLIQALGKKYYFLWFQYRIKKQLQRYPIYKNETKNKVNNILKQHYSCRQTFVLINQLGLNISQKIISSIEKDIPYKIYEDFSKKQHQLIQPKYSQDKLSLSNKDNSSTSAQQSPYKNNQYHHKKQIFQNDYKEDIKISLENVRINDYIGTPNQILQQVYFDPKKIYIKVSNSKQQLSKEQVLKFLRFLVFNQSQLILLQCICSEQYKLQFNKIKQLSALLILQGSRTKWNQFMKKIYVKKFLQNQNLEIDRCFEHRYPSIQIALFIKFKNKFIKNLSIFQISKKLNLLIKQALLKTNKISPENLQNIQIKKQASNLYVHAKFYTKKISNSQQEVDALIKQLQSNHKLMDNLLCIQKLNKGTRYPSSEIFIYGINNFNQNPIKQQQISKIKDYIIQKTGKTQNCIESCFISNANNSSDRSTYYVDITFKEKKDAYQAFKILRDLEDSAIVGDSKLYFSYKKFLDLRTVRLSKLSPNARQKDINALFASVKQKNKNFNFYDYQIANVKGFEVIYVNFYHEKSKQDLQELKKIIKSHYYYDAIFQTSKDKLCVDYKKAHTDKKRGIIIRHHAVIQ